MMLNGYVVLADLFADTVVFRQSLLTNLQLRYISSVAINLHLVLCRTNKLPLQMGLCLHSAEEKVEYTDSERERDGKRGGELGGGQVKKWYSQIPTVVHFFGYRCGDKLALSYLKTPMGPNVSSRGEKGGIKWVSPQKLILGAGYSP